MIKNTVYTTWHMVLFFNCEVTHFLTHTGAPGGVLVSDSEPVEPMEFEEDAFVHIEKDFGSLMSSTPGKCTETHWSFQIISEPYMRILFGPYLYLSGHCILEIICMYPPELFHQLKMFIGLMAVQTISLRSIWIALQCSYKL